MPKLSQKHEKQTILKELSFSGGINWSIPSTALALNELYLCNNMEYLFSKDDQGNTRATLRKRPGTVKISHTTLPSGANVKAVYYYKTHTQYILATATKLYYLDGSYDPVEIGTIQGVPTFTEFNGKLIIHDSGTTKAWDGTTFETLDCTYTNENIGTGDGAETSFSGTIANPVITGSSLTITATDTAGNTLTVTDDGEGMLSGNSANDAILEDDCSNLTGWTDADDGDAATTQVEFTGKQCFKMDSGVNSAANNDFAYIYQDVGTFGNFTDITIDLYHDALGAYITDTDCFILSVENGTYHLFARFGTDGLFILHDGGHYEIGTNIVSEDTWQSWRFAINWVAGTVNIYLDDVLQIGQQGISELSGTNGLVKLYQYGYTTNSRISYVDNVNIYNGNMIDYTTGAYNLTFSAAPVDGGSVLATYKKVGAAPKSKGGFVRKERLYMWGSSDYPSRLFYSGTSDTGGEYEWSTSAGGGYLDFDKDDGYNILSCLNYSQSVLLFKENKMGRLDNFPGDAIFRIEPLNSAAAAYSYNGCTITYDLVAMTSKSHIYAIEPTSLYQGSQQLLSLTNKIFDNFRYGAGQYTMLEYYPHRNQLWCQPRTTQTGDGSSTLWVIQMPYGAISQFRFAFTATCIKYVNNEMLIGGADGNLYRADEMVTNYLDNEVSYSTESGVLTRFKTGNHDFGEPLRKKIIKNIYVKLQGSGTTTGKIKLYVNNSSTAFSTHALATDRPLYEIEVKPNITCSSIAIEGTELHSTYGPLDYPVHIIGIYIEYALIGDD